MLRKSAPEGFVLATSRPEPQPPRSILKKPSSTPTSSTSSAPSSPSRQTPPTSPTSDLFAMSGYRPQQWSVVCIAKAQQRPSSDPSRKQLCLTVTLLYMPTETLYAWPFNLSSPDAKGVCYETHSAEEEGEPARIPPEGTMSISLRVLADVIRKWMTIRGERSALSRRRGSSASLSRLPGSPGSSFDDVVDNDEVVDEIIEDLRLYPLTPFERSVYLLRQKLPHESIEEPSPAEQRSRRDSVPSPGAQSDSSWSSSDAGSEDESRSRNHSTSSISSRGSMADASPSHSPKDTSPPELPKLDTTLSSKKEEEIPQSRSNEATPRAEAYEDRNMALEKAAHSRIRDSRYGGRSMNTVHEDACESDDADVSTPTHYSAQRAQAAESLSPRTVVAAISDAIEAASSSSSTTPSPSKVIFRDPFQGAKNPPSKPAIQAEVIDEDSPETQVAFSTRGKPKLKTSSKRSSLSGFRSIFGGRSKSH